MDVLSTYNISVAVLFSIWFVVTIICQFKDSKLTDAIKEFDFFMLIPLWTFFAPNPGTKDYHLLYREKNEKGMETEWLELNIKERRRVWSFLWNPRKRRSKILSDVIQGLLQLMPRFSKQPNSIMLSLSYLLVLNFISQQKGQIEGIKSRQFMLVESDGYIGDNDPTLILLSPDHPINQ